MSKSLLHSCVVHTHPCTLAIVYACICLMLANSCRCDNPTIDVPKHMTTAEEEEEEDDVAVIMQETGLATPPLSV